MLFSVQLHLPDAIFRPCYLTVYVFAVFFVFYAIFLNFTALVIAVPATSNKFCILITVLLNLTIKFQIISCLQLTSKLYAYNRVANLN